MQCIPADPGAYDILVCFKDVMIDTSDALAGMILLFVGYAYIKRKKQATDEKN